MHAQPRRHRSPPARVRPRYTQREHLARRASQIHRTPASCALSLDKIFNARPVRRPCPHAQHRPHGLRRKTHPGGHHRPIAACRPHADEAQGGAGRLARDLPARQGRRSQSTGFVGIRHRQRPDAPAGRFQGRVAWHRSPERCRKSPPRAPTHRRAHRHRRLPMGTGCARAAVPARWRVVSVRPAQDRRGSSAQAHPRRRLRHRCQALAQGRLRQLRARTQRVGDRSGQWQRAATHPRWQRDHRQWHGRIRRRRRNGSPHRLLVGAGRFGHCLCAHRRIARAGAKAPGSVCRPHRGDQPTLSAGRPAKCSGAAGRDRTACQGGCALDRPGQESGHLSGACGLARCATADLPAPVARPENP